MRKLITVSVAGLAIALAACSREERVDTAGDAEAAAEKIGAEARDAVNSPELKEMGSEIKEAAQDVGQVAKGAVAGAKDAAGDVAAESRDEVQDANRAADKAANDATN
jgi:hypothetical protein